jgi:hypothetical protein
MNFLVDTNVVAEWVKPRPNPGVVAWLADTKEDQVFLSVVALTDAKMGPEGADQQSPGRRPISANLRQNPYAGGPLPLIRAKIGKPDLNFHLPRRGLERSRPCGGRCACVLPTGLP